MKKKVSIKINPVKIKKSKLSETFEDHYHLYVRVTYDRKSTKFKLSMPTTVFSEKDIKSLENENTTIQLKRWMTSIVNFEIKKFREKFILNGIGNRMEFYFRELVNHTNHYGLYHRMLYNLEDVLTYRKFKILEEFQYQKLDDTSHDLFELYLLEDCYYLKNDLKLNFEKVFDNDLYKLLKCYCHFSHFEYYNNTIAKKELRNKFEVNLERLGDWLTNSLDIKKRFYDFLVLKKNGKLIRSKTNKTIFEFIDKTFKYEKEEIEEIVNTLSPLINNSGIFNDLKQLHTSMK